MFDELSLEDLPRAMDKMGWKVSAQMMRRWFENTPVWRMPEKQRSGDGVDYRTLAASKIDEKIIKMQWLLDARFQDQIGPIYNDLYRNWNSEPGVNLLRQRLAVAGWVPGKMTRIGQNLVNAKDLEHVCQVNSRKFGGLADTLNDLFGSVFKATMKLAVVGTAAPDSNSGKDVFKVEKIGIYIRDTYDFNADKIDDLAYGLGVWSRDRVLSKAESLLYMTNSKYKLVMQAKGFWPVRNEDFRSYQEKNIRGGDYYVFSDVQWVQSNVKDIVL